MEVVATGGDKGVGPRFVYFRVSRPASLLYTYDRERGERETRPTNFPWSLFPPLISKHSALRSYWWMLVQWIRTSCVANCRLT
ncbi:Hypothetical predicted protein [Podarcis lilfordi]|uniref:Uncharacterized protein n=1 Tax=Podarcis lilfordi TaxID=74358 RepID=A0AA35JM42_9SAUR|nr:Hypothetical predicted protein [Podarcis lilfordi]